MSRSLKQIVDKYLLTHTRTDLAAAIGTSEATLCRWIKKGVPTGKQAREIAIKCGCGDDEADRLATVEASSRVAKTA